MDKDKLNALLNFDIKIYGNMIPYTQTLSKCRCRIFYKYANRNGTYITDEFAEELIKTLPYAPIKGIYDDIDEDYTDHGKHRSSGKIYGIVPIDNNFAWEEHLDEDGISRNYACSDVLIYTALYQEANQIVQQGLSMEIYDKSVEGDWQIIDGLQYYVFKKGCFLGLQILGKEVEPCFEGAAFYSLYQNIYDGIKEALEELKKYNLQKNTSDEKGQEGKEKMSRIKFAKTTDNFLALWQLLNTEFTEDKEWTISHNILTMTDTYAIVHDLVNDCFKKVNFTIKEEESEDENGEKKINSTLETLENEDVILEVTDTETLNILLASLGLESMTSFSELADAVSTLNQRISDFEQKIVEKDELISTLQTEKSELQSANETQTTELNTLTTELDTLKQYKLDIEKEQKKTIIAKYSAKLDTDIIQQFTDNIDNYSFETLDKELAYALVQSDNSIFEQNIDEGNNGRVPKTQEKTGLAAILSKY